jgi:hypothetical protein
LIAGITGHQDLGDAVAWVRHVLADQIHHHHVTRGLTSLAIGTDQLFAEILLGHSIPYDAILPSTGYEETFHGVLARSRFDDLISRAAQVERLAYDAPSEASFFAAGRAIVSRCSLLFAVWNGEPARGLGGTGDVVEYAKSYGRRWIHIDPQYRSVRDGAP